MDSRSDEQHGAEMIGVYKWIIGALSAIVIMFGGYYVNSVQIHVTSQSQQLLNHEQRITTLEESKRNTEQLLNEIKNKLDFIQDVITKRN